ncbi:MAG: DUF1836 domain-containing protein [Lachnospiraceae bacterium]|nr:DUF1836 domain-containing protein [Lachnospiraceae bacterium]
MDKSKINDLKKMAESFILPSYEDIPDVGLFLEQVVRYVAKYAEPTGIQPLTGSMISNYVKKKIISNPVKKMYDRDQIAYLLFIAFTKNVIQLEDMQMLFDIQKKDHDIKDAYKYFTDQLRDCIFNVFRVENRNTDTQKSETSDPDTVFDHRTLLKNICITVAHKIYLDSCIRLYTETGSEYL